jgi:hypothetical protein
VQVIEGPGRFKCGGVVRAVCLSAQNIRGLIHTSQSDLKKMSNDIR